MPCLRRSGGKLTSLGLLPQIVAPNADTLYSIAWLDLTSGPLVISIPATNGRFYVLQFLDAYTNTPLLIGASLSGYVSFTSAF